MTKLCVHCMKQRELTEFLSCRPTTCRECNREKCRQYHAAHRDRILARKRHYDAVKPKTRVPQRTNPNRVRNKEKSRQQFKKWSENNKSARSEYRRRYLTENRDKANRYCAERRARKRASSIDASCAGVYALCQNEKRIKCYWCKRVTVHGDRQVDHIVPLARGGMHSAENLCIACKICNQSKHSLMPEEFSGQGEMFGRMA